MSMALYLYLYFHPGQYILDEDEEVGAGVNTLIDVYLYLYLYYHPGQYILDEDEEEGAGVNTLMDLGVRQTPLVTHD